MRSLNYKNLSNEIKFNTNSIENTPYDSIMFNKVKERSKRLLELENKNLKDYPQYKELNLDLFNTLYKYDPMLVPERQIKYEFLLNSYIVKQITETKQYKELRNFTRLDAISSTVSTEVLSYEAFNILNDVKEKAKELVDALNKLANELEQLEPKESGDKNQSGGTGQKGDKEKEGISAKMQQALSKLEELVKNDNIKKALQKSIQKALDTTFETSEFINNWGLDQSEDYSKGDYQEKLRILDRLRNSKKLRNIAELSGRYRRLAANTEREKIKKGMEEVYDIIPGNELSKLLASEKLKLLNSSTTLLFKKDFLEQRLLQYETSGKEKKQMGAVVVCIDNSGSMSGQPEIWSKSVALGILEITKKQKRDLYVIHFDSNPKNKLYCNHFPKDKYDINEIINMCEHFSGGGTLFEPPLDLARDKISEIKDFKKADIVFITDGETEVSQKWLTDFLKWKNISNVIIRSILIDSYYNSDSVLKKFSNELVKLSELRNEVDHKSDALATSIFKGL